MQQFNNKCENCNGNLRLIEFTRDGFSKVKFWLVGCVKCDYKALVMPKSWINWPDIDTLKSLYK